MLHELRHDLGLGAHRVDVRHDDHLAAARVARHRGRDVLGHDVLRDAAGAQLGQERIVVEFGVVDEHARSDEHDADDEHRQRDARHEDADSGNDRSKRNGDKRQGVRPARPGWSGEFVDVDLETAVGEFLRDI